MARFSVQPHPWLRVSGVSAVVEAAKVPLSDAAKAVLAADPPAVEMVLTGGDDYEIICTVPPAKVSAFRNAAKVANVPVTDIGEIVAGEGISVEVIDLRTVAPLDMEPILASVHKTSRLLIAHEAVVPFGIGAEIAATVAREGFWDLDAPIARLGAAPTPPPYAPNLVRAWLPDREDVAAALRQLTGT